MLRLSPRGEIASPWTISVECPNAVKDQEYIVASTAGRYTALFKAVLCAWGGIVGEVAFVCDIQLQTRQDRSFISCSLPHMSFQSTIVGGERSSAHLEDLVGWIMPPALLGKRIIIS